LAVVLVFGLRAGLVAVGTTWAIRWGGGAIPFIVGFFGIYFPLQWIEIRYLLLSLKGERGET
jgi:hypothetical protein